MATRVEDSELADQIKLVGEWTPEQLRPVLKSILDAGHEYDATVAMVPIEMVVQGLHAAAPYSFLLGDGGVVLLSPLVVGLSAGVHVHIWDPRWRGRYTLLRSLTRWIFNKWSLQRISAFYPARNVRTTSLAENVGFTLEGRLRNAVQYTRGEEVHLDDLLIYGLFPEE